MPFPESMAHLLRLRQSTIQFRARKSTRLRAVTSDAKQQREAIASILSLAKRSPAAAKKAKKGGLALTGKKRKVKDVMAETEEERERKRQLREKAMEREAQRLQRERAEVEQHRAHLQHIQAVFDPAHIDLAIAALCTAGDSVDSDDDEEIVADGDLTELSLAREESDQGTQQLTLLSRLDDADSLASDESLSSAPPLLSPSSSSSSSASPSPLSIDSTVSLHSTPPPPASLAFDLSLDWPYLTQHSLFYLIAYSPLPSPSLFHPPGVEPPVPSSAPAFKPITRNQWRGKRAVVKKAKGRNDEEGDGRCGCRTKARAIEEAEQHEARERAERRKAGCPTLDDLRLEAEEEARKRATIDTGYLAKPVAPASFNCSDRCINALLLVECDDSNCSVGAELCHNRHFTRSEEALVEPFPTELKGWGLRAKADLPADRFLIEYVGEVINNAECRHRIEKEDARVRRQVDKLRAAAAKQRGKGQKKGAAAAVVEEAKEGDALVCVESNYYFMSVADDVIIDAGVKGSVARFINHSCDANCLIAKWTVQGELRIAIFTQRPVRRGEELTIDYKYDRIGLEYQACYCGADNCAKWIGGKKKKLERGGGVDDAVAEGARKAKGKKRGKLSHKALKRMAFNQADDVCAVCGEAGEVVMCDAKVTGSVFCPRVFHARCVDMEAAPKGGWTCPWHFCKRKVLGTGVEGEGEGEGGGEGEVCGRKAAQFCVGCSESRCAKCREEEGDLGVSWRESRVYRAGAMEESGREWLLEEGTPDWRWVLCEDCERHPLVMKEREEQLWEHRMGTAPQALFPLLPPSPAAPAPMTLPLLPKLDWAAMETPLPLLPKLEWEAIPGGLC